MKITGKNLRLVRNALDLADAELHNMIATCPDVIEYAEDIEDYERQREELSRFMAKIDAAIQREEIRDENQND